MYQQIMRVTALVVGVTLATVGTANAQQHTSHSGGHAGGAHVAGAHAGSFHVAPGHAYAGTQHYSGARPAYPGHAYNGGHAYSGYRSYGNYPYYRHSYAYGYPYRNYSTYRYPYYGYGLGGLALSLGYYGYPYSYYSGSPYYYASSYPNYLDYTPSYAGVDVITPSTSAYPPAEVAPVPVTNTARITVEVPDGARLWIDGQLSNQTGPMRTFETPATLEPGRSYSYRLVAEWVENGQTVSRERTVQFAAGNQLVVNLTVS